MFGALLRINLKSLKGSTNSSRYSTMTPKVVSSARLFPLKGEIMKLDRGMTRREMLKGALLAIPGFMALLAAGKNAVAAEAKGAKAKGAEKKSAGSDMVSENDPTAKALKYVADSSRTAKGRPAKMSVDGDKQMCSNCQFYTKEDDNKGKCLMITSGKVSSKGWCASWTKKA